MKKVYISFSIGVLLSLMLYAQTSTDASQGKKPEEKSTVESEKIGDKSGAEKQLSADVSEKEASDISPENTNVSAGGEEKKESISEEAGEEESDSDVAEKEASGSDTSVENVESIAKEEDIPEAGTDIAESDTVTEEDSTATAESVDDSASILRIITVPESAAVIFDDVSKGTSPVVIDNIPAGKHTIEIKKKGYFLKKATVMVTAGSDNPLKFKLIKPAILSITSKPKQAYVLINKEKAGTTPYTDDKLKPGKYDITLSMDGYEKKDSSVTLDSGGSDSIHVDLVKLSKAPEDTTSEVKKDKTVEEKAGKDKTKVSSILDKVALGIFIAFTLVILLVELTRDN